MMRADNIRKSIENQISDLQQQIQTLRGNLGDAGAGAYGAADEQAREAMKLMRRQTAAMSQAARENPASAATVLSVVALTCLGLGYLAGRSVSDDRW